MQISPTHWRFPCPEGRRRRAGPQHSGNEEGPPGAPVAARRHGIVGGGPGTGRPDRRDGETGCGDDVTERLRGWNLLLRGIRVYELAKELNVNSKDIIRLLASEMHIEKNNHMATLNDQVAARVRQLVAEERGATAAPKPKARSRPAATAPLPPQASASPASGQRPAPAPANRTGARPVRSGPPTGPIHFQPTPGMLPLMTPRPTPPRTRRAQRREQPVPEVVRPTLEPVRPAEPEQPEAAPREVESGHPAVVEIQTPPVGAEPRVPEPEAPLPVEEAPQQAPHAEPVMEKESSPLPQAPTTQPLRPTPPLAKVEATVPTQEARQVRAGLLPVRKIVPGAPPPRRDPERPLLPIRKAEPRPANEGGGAAPAASAVPVETGAARGRHAGDHRRPGEAPEIRRRGGAGRRPARPGGVRFGEGETDGPRRRGRRRRRLNLLGHLEAQMAPPEGVELSGPIVVADLAELLRTSVMEIIKILLAEGVMAAINDQIELEQARLVCERLGIAVDSGEGADAPASPVDRETVGRLLAADNPERQAQRPPIVAILGHVDHGKTTLLDAIRSTRVVEGEAGGITQHIGAYVVRHGDRRLTFLDTPGHEAFTAMRARGAQVTDIAVLVVAADDGVMPQTLEAISHARAAGVPIVVALNKIDRPNANPDRVLQQLTEHGLQPEAWGGDTIVVPVSALRKEGIGDLLDMLLLVADMQELAADPDRDAVGTIVEAQVTRGRGPVATVLVQSGTLRVGDAFVAGQVFGRVRAMVDDLGHGITEVGPSTPVEVLGFTEVPEAGDPFQVMSEREARQVAAERQAANRQETVVTAGRAQSLADFRGDGEGERITDLRIILKADVQGSLEAVRGSLEKLHNDEARTVLLHAGVGPVSESDVMLASASDAVILGFNVRPDAGAAREAQRVSVEIKTYRIIYEMLDDVQKALDGLLQPKFETVTVGHAEVRKPIRVPDIGVIAGSYVSDGIVRRGAPCRVVRHGTIVHEGTIGSLRRFKDDVREVAAGFECGIGLERWNDVKEGDVVEVLEQREVPR